MSLADVQAVEPPPGFGPLSAEVFFSDAHYLDADVRTLTADTRYASTGAYMALCEFFSVSHLLKTVSLYQSSELPPQAHTNSIAQLQEFRRRLCLGDEYKVRLIYFSDSSKRPSSIKGWHFQDDDGIRQPVANLDNVECFIVRAALTPASTNLVAPSAPSATSSVVNAGQEVFQTMKGNKFHLTKDCHKILKAKLKAEVETIIVEEGFDATQICKACVKVRPPPLSVRLYLNRFDYPCVYLLFLKLRRGFAMNEATLLVRLAYPHMHLDTSRYLHTCFSGEAAT
jgi:hypothetical protein